MKELVHAILNFLKDRFNLDEDKADEKDITDSIRKEVHFKGPNLWTLIFAIMIASVGLNVNSSAVIISAVLISPMMGSGIVAGTQFPKSSECQIFVALIYLGLIISRLCLRVIS